MKEIVEKKLDKVSDYLASEKFEKKMDKVTWWFLGFAVSYFVIRFLIGVLFGV